MDQEADYVLALEDKHPTLHEDIATWLDHCDARGDVRQVESIDKDHGRLERRRVVATNLALIRRAALNLLRDHDSSNVSIRRRKMRCGTNHDYRRQILFGEKPSPATAAT